MGVGPEVVTGDEEARLSYLGATRSLLGSEHPQPFLVVDIGGGSTELILGSGTEVEAARSLDIGSVRMTERHLVGDPPTHAQVEAAAGEVDQALDELAAHGIDPGRGRTVVGVAGTITTVAAAVLDLPGWDYDAIHHASLARDDVHATVARLLAMTYDERRALPYMHPGRADVIGAGALILDRVLARTSTDRLLVSQTDILDGIAWSVA
jgi:exopolyphosphatase/guanosine-5'-triphosphate,3'-diphosphate pyrophosphatase